MRMRTTAILVGLLAAALWAVPAEAKLVYVKRPETASPVVYVAKDNGKDPRRLGIGRAPTISPDGQWVAFVTVPNGGSEMETVVLQKLKAGSQRLVMRSDSIDSLRFSPDSKKLGAIAASKRVRVYDIPNDALHVAASGNLRGFAFSPDSEQLVYGKAVKEDFQSASDLYTVPALGGKETRLTDGKNALNPVWGTKEIVFDRFKRRKDDAPAYNLWALDPAAPETPPPRDQPHDPAARERPRAAGDLRRREAAAHRLHRPGRRGRLHRVAESGKTRALSQDFESGTVGFDLSADGKTILAHTGGPDPGNAHDVVTVPWARGGKTKVIVEDAAYPDWTR